jgi:hypothetical protein
MLQLSAPYRRRPITFLETWEDDGWRLKIYGISALSEIPSSRLISAIKSVARTVLPRPAIAADRYGVGFLYAHQGRNGGGYASVNWWLNENELHHFQYEASPGGLDDLKSVEVTGSPIACTWDLAVMSFERDAWVETVLDNKSGPDLEAYLSRRMNADV